MEILSSDAALAAKEDLAKAASLLKQFEKLGDCSQFAVQKIQQWSEEVRTRFDTNMNIH